MVAAATEDGGGVTTTRIVDFWSFRTAYTVSSKFCKKNAEEWEERASREKKDQTKCRLTYQGIAALQKSHAAN